MRLSIDDKETEDKQLKEREHEDDKPRKPDQRRDEEKVPGAPK